MVLHTPVSHWMSMPIEQAVTWELTAARLKDED